jgi:hypothetical protein
MNYIIGKLNSEQEIQEAAQYLQSIGYIPTKRAGRRVTDSAIRLFEREGIKYYAFGNYEGYLRYKKTGIKPYNLCDVHTLSVFKLLDTMAKTVVTKPAPIKVDMLGSPITTAPLDKIETNTVTRTVQLPNADYIQLKKSDLVTAYNKVSPELKQLLVFMCGGKEMFVETFYKVGDKFERGSKQYVIIRINPNVISLMDCETFSPFSSSKQVINSNAITEAELHSLMGSWYNLFKLIK